MKVSINVSFGKDGYFKECGIIEAVIRLLKNIGSAKEITISRHRRWEDGKYKGCKRF